MELLEREEYLAEMAATLNQAAAGFGHAVFVSGEAGIGKTSLVERFTEQNAESSRVLWGACDALFTPRPLGPLYDIARQMRGSLRPLIEAEAPRANIFSAFLDELQSKAPATIIVIEDVHWADEATFDFLKFMGRRVQRFPCLLLVTYRDDEVGAQHPLRYVLGDLPRRITKHLHLPLLSKAAVSALAERRGLEGESVYRATGGNPFFVTEVLESKGQSVPVTVRDAVLSRASRLSPAARSVLELVSVVPAKAERWLLESVLAPAALVMDECICSGILRLEENTVSFRHELARMAVEDSLSTTRRQTLNARVLEALSNRAREQGQLARLVHHASEAGDTQAVLRFAPEAALEAAALKAHREAALHYQTALRYADALPPQERAALLEGRSYECYITHQMEEAREARMTALKIWEELGQLDRQGDNLRWISRLSHCSSHKAEAERCAVEAVTILEGLPPGPELAMAYADLSRQHMLRQETEEAVHWGTRAFELAERLGATEVLVHALTNVGSARWQAGDKEGFVLLERSFQLSLAHDLQDEVSRAYENFASVTVSHRDYEAALSYINEGINYTTERDIDNWTLHIMAWRARAHFEQGNWASADEDAGQVLGRYSVDPYVIIPVLVVLGHLRVRRGDPEAASALDKAHDLAQQTGLLIHLGPVAAARAEAAWWKGDVAGTLQEARGRLRTRQAA